MDAPAIALPASALTTCSVTDADGDELGEVEDLLLDAANGQIAVAVVAVGGFLGFGGELRPVPWSALLHMPDEERLVLTVPKEKLEGAPSLEAAEVRDLGSPEWQDRLYRHYGLEPPGRA